MHFYLEICRFIHLQFCCFHRRSGCLAWVFLKERGLCFQSHIAWALLQLNWSVNLWKKLRNHTVQSSVNHCDSFTSEACIITAKACSAAWFNSHAIIGASELDGGRVFLSKHCHLTCCVSDHTGPDIIDSSLLEEYL